MAKTPKPDQARAGYAGEAWFGSGRLKEQKDARVSANNRPNPQGETMPPRHLPDPLDSIRTEIDTGAGRIACYSGRSGTPEKEKTPLLLIHSVNAAASAFEVKPLFDHYKQIRPVYALDLPGFGQSERSDRAYTIRVMVDAIQSVVAKISLKHALPIDAMALSLSCEFLARAGVEDPARFRSLALISPTGFEGRARDESGGTRGKEWMRRSLNCPLWSSRLFSAMTVKPVIRKFLEKTWGSKAIDQPLLNYAYQSAHQPGAEHAPYYFVSGHLFSKDILRVYQALELPVWMVRGTRGDFVDYHHATRLKDRENWTFDIFDSGAFPQYEKLPELVGSYERFLEIALRFRNQETASRKAPLQIAN